MEAKENGTATDEINGISNRFFWKKGVSKKGDEYVKALANRSNDKTDTPDNNLKKDC